MKLDPKLKHTAKKDFGLRWEELPPDKRKSFIINFVGEHLSDARFRTMTRYIIDIDLRKKLNECAIRYEEYDNEIIRL